MGRKAIYANPAERTAAYRARKAGLENPAPKAATPWADLSRSRRLQVLLLAIGAELEGWSDDLPTPGQAEKVTAAIAGITAAVNALQVT